MVDRSGLQAESTSSSNQPTPVCVGICVGSGGTGGPGGGPSPPGLKQGSPYVPTSPRPLSTSKQVVAMVIALSLIAKFEWHQSPFVRLFVRPMFQQIKNGNWAAVIADGEGEGLLALLLGDFFADAPVFATAGTSLGDGYVAVASDDAPLIANADQMTAADTTAGQGVGNAVEPGAATGLRAELTAQQTLSSSGRIVLGDSIELGGTRTALFDTETGTLYTASAGPMTHLGLADALGLPLEGGRYVGGFVTVSEEGAVSFEASSGTFPVGGADAPNVLDMIRGTGVSVAQ
jgi:hypothetical protein